MKSRSICIPGVKQGKQHVKFQMGVKCVGYSSYINDKNAIREAANLPGQCWH